MFWSKNKPKAAEPDNIAKAISKKLNAVSVSRAMTIARTETHRAANTTQFRRAEWAANTANLKWKSNGLQQMMGGA